MRAIFKFMNTFILCAGIMAFLFSPTEAASYYSGDYYYNNYNPGCCPPCPPVACCNPKPSCCFDCGWNCGGCWVKGSGLWTRASDSGLAFALTDKKKTAGGTRFKNSFARPEQHWDWGWRAEAGGQICGCWDLGAGYTQLKDHASGSRSNSGANFILPIYGSFVGDTTTLGGAVTANVHADWHLKIDYADVTVSRAFCLGNCVSIKPHVGGRYARIHSHYDVKNHFIGVPTGFTAVNENIELENRFYGYGIAAGLDASWDIGCGLVLVSDATGSIVYGKNHFSFHDRINLFTDGKATADFRDSSTASRYIVDLGAELRWESTCGCGIWGVFAGYEAHIYVNANNFYNDGIDLFDPSLAEGARSDIVVQGGRFGAYFKF